MGPDATILVFRMLNFKPAFSLSFIFIKRLFSSSLSAIRMVSSAYLRLLILLPATLIPACASSSLAFPMMSCLKGMRCLLGVMKMLWNCVSMRFHDIVNILNATELYTLNGQNLALYAMWILPQFWKIVLLGIFKGASFPPRSFDIFLTD